MKIGLLSISDATCMLSLYDDQTKTIRQKKSLTSKNIIRTLPMMWQQLFSDVRHVYIHIGADRFSLTRQLALVANIMAHQYRQKMYVTREPFSKSPEQFLQKIRRVRWQHIIMPLYAAEPNITKRKPL